MTADRQAPALPPINRLCLSVAEAAEALRVSSRQIYNLARDAGLPTIRLLGRRLIRRADLEAWIAAQPVDRPGTNGPETVPASGSQDGAKGAHP